MFDRIVVVDWSASASPTAGADSIWIADEYAGAAVAAQPHHSGESIRVPRERDRRRGPVANTDRVRLLARLSGRDRSCARPRRVCVAGHVGPPRIDGRRRRSEQQQPIRRRGGAQRHDGVASRSVLGLPTDRASGSSSHPHPTVPASATTVPAPGGWSRRRCAPRGIGRPHRGNCSVRAAWAARCWSGSRSWNGSGDPRRSGSRSGRSPRACDHHAIVPASSRAPRSGRR